MTNLIQLTGEAGQGGVVDVGVLAVTDRLIPVPELCKVGR